MGEADCESIRVFLRERIGQVASQEHGDSAYKRGYVEGCRYALVVVNVLEGVAARARSEGTADEG